ncbi:hypothetical protein ACHAPD_000511 [Fusarium lateritium]
MSTSTLGTRLKGKVCIVTGSSSGLGRSIALGYSHEGALLVCADLQQDARAQLNGEEEISTDELIRHRGGKAIFVQTDVSKRTAVEELVTRTVIQFGRVDVLVNNAGISIEAGKTPCRIHETPEEWWDLTMAVNLKSIFLASKYAIAQMLKQERNESGDRGWIINISSIFGVVGGYTIHTETAIFADTIKMHDKESIRAKHPLHGTGTPQDLVGAAIFLASQEARWITGVCLPVDGGFTAQ